MLLSALQSNCHIYTLTVLNTLLFYHTTKPCVVSLFPLMCECMPLSTHTALPCHRRHPEGNLHSRLVFIPIVFFLSSSKKSSTISFFGWVFALEPCQWMYPVFEQRDDDDGKQANIWVAVQIGFTFVEVNVDNFEFGKLFSPVLLFLPISK